MGYFSWKTSDTQESISNKDATHGPTPCKMLLPNGQIFLEHEYEGYGVFGGRDFYEELAKLNGLTTSEEGIELEFSGTPNVIKPKLVSINFDGNYNDVQDSEPCEFQGYFYIEEEDEWVDEEECGW